MTIHDITEAMIKAIKKETGHTVEVMVLDSGSIINCSREAAAPVKALLAQVKNIQLDNEGDWGDDPDFADAPIQLDYINI